VSRTPAAEEARRAAEAAGQPFPAVTKKEERTKPGTFPVPVPSLPDFCDRTSPAVPAAASGPRSTPEQAAEIAALFASLPRLTPAEIEAGRSPAGGFTRAQLAAWGVPWPPPAGWLHALLHSEDNTVAGPT
jgi:hypothetical protein